MEQVKTKKKWWLPVTAALVLVIGLLGAQPAWYFYKDVSFYWTEHTETEYRVKAYAEEKGISYGRYPQSLINLLERNPETETFVLDYPFREEGEIDLSEYEDSESVPLFLQWDPRWGYEKYGSDVIGITGCGPTCLAMVGYYLTGDINMNPAQIADFAWKNGYYESGYGSSWTLISEGGEKLGLEVTELPLVKKKITDSLEAGNPVILAMGPGDFTTSGHYIVLTGVEDGQFRVNDPNSRANSGRLWSYEELEGQIRNIWSVCS
ncbi:MAG: C39 family peptidase [Oscillospiraceae bacterium]|nr:C39 family peptidase [Oscillospiraceae bacterium]